LLDKISEKDIELSQLNNKISEEKEISNSLNISLNKITEDKRQLLKEHEKNNTNIMSE